MGLHQGLDDLGIPHEIYGVDNKPQKRYPFHFVLGDALKPPFDLREFDFIWASPPCQAFTMMQHICRNADAHPDLVEATRGMLKATGRPYVIENVKGAPLDARLMLCGTMFGLDIIRHRYFESDFLPMLLLPPCNHTEVYDPWHGHGRTADKFRAAMGIDWMPIAGGTNKKGSVDLAIPPAYSRYIIKQVFGNG